MTADTAPQRASHPTRRQKRRQSDGRPIRPDLVRDGGNEFHCQKLGAAGKTGKQALIACMRKLLVIRNAMLRDKTRWTVA